MQIPPRLLAYFFLFGLLTVLTAVGAHSPTAGAHSPIAGAHSPIAGGIAWVESFDDALAKAKAENKPIFIAVNMDGEPVCEELVKRHYRDGKIVTLSGSTVNLFASRFSHKGSGKNCARVGTITCRSHQQVERDVRRDVFKIAPGEPVNAPNHIWLNPDGSVILSVPFMITTGQLEWCMVEAIRKVDPAFEWTLRASARAPRRLIYGDPREGAQGETESKTRGATGGASADPLDREALEEVLDAVKKGSGRGDRGNTARQYFPSLIVTDDKKAIEFIESWFASRWASGRQAERLLHEIGRTSPPSFWEAAAAALSHPDLAMRNEAIVALEQLAEPKSLKALLKQKSSEKEDAAAANLIRAIASVGRGKKSAESLVLRTAARDKKDFMRIHGIIGLVYIEDREKVNDVLVKSLSSDNPGIRAAAAYTIAIRREHDLRDALAIAIEGEKDLTCKTYLGAAAAALRGGGLRLIEGVLREYALDDIVRDRE